MRYRITASTGQPVDEGEGRADMVGGTIVISPTLGQPLRLRTADILEIGQAEPYVIRLRLADGHTVDLLQLGVLRTQLLGDITAARTTALLSLLPLAGVGQPEIFPGAMGDVDAELRIYDDALVAVPVAGAPEPVPFAFIESVESVSGYRVDVGIGEGPPMQIQHLARRTTEFAELLRRRVTAARGRTGAFIGTLLPGLGPIPLRRVSELLRDGLAARKADLDAVDPTVWPALLAAVAAPDRAHCAAVLEEMGEVSLGFKQLVSVEVAGGGVAGTPARQPQVVVNHGNAGGSGDGLQHVLGAEIVQASIGAVSSGQSPLTLAGGGMEGPLGPLEGILAMQMLGNQLGASSPPLGHPAPAATPRAEPSQARSTPSSTDEARLTAEGQAPTVLAFLYCATGRSVIYEVLNAGDRCTDVYRADGGEVRRINRAMALLGMRGEGIPDDTSTAASHHREAVRRLPCIGALSSSLVGSAIHDDGWEGRLRSLV